MAMSLGSSSSRRRRGGSRRAPMAEINVTPFVDVMLVLLIIFMVTAPLLNSGVPLDLPDSRANAMDNEAQSITISLDAEGNAFIDDTPVPAGGFASALEGIDQTGADGSGGPDVVLRADRALDYGRVKAIMGELNRAGLNRISLVTGRSSDAP